MRRGSLDRVLKVMKIERQAYFGGTFVGNHVHKCRVHVREANNALQIYLTWYNDKLYNITVFQIQNFHYVFRTGRKHKTPMQQFH